MEKAIDEFLQIAGSSHGIILVASDGPDAPYLPIRALQSILNKNRGRRASALAGDAGRPVGKWVRDPGVGRSGSHVGRRARDCRRAP